MHFIILVTSRVPTYPRYLIFYSAFAIKDDACIFVLYYSLHRSCFLYIKLHIHITGHLHFGALMYFNEMDTLHFALLQGTAKVEIGRNSKFEKLSCELRLLCTTATSN